MRRKQFGGDESMFSGVYVGIIIILILAAFAGGFYMYARFFNAVDYVRPDYSPSYPGIQHSGHSRQPLPHAPKHKPRHPQAPKKH